MTGRSKLPSLFSVFLAVLLAAFIVNVSLLPVERIEAKPAKPSKDNPAVTPQPRIAEWWFARHAK